MKRAVEPEATADNRKRIHLEDASEADGGETIRRKRRKFALLLSYSGKGYLGMQRNPGYRTIEDDLLTALLHADLMTEEGCTCPQMFHFQRAARTDKGVSAARQVVSVRLPDDVPNMVEAINKHLCNQIRVMAIRRTTKSFNCKSWCDSRTYSYMCPTFAFAPSVEVTNEKYRITPQVLDKLKATLKLYKGTHNFHNFTARKKAQDASANRYIMDIDCGKPFEREGMEWVIIKIKGQSFMLHQIRKMVGLAMAVCRGLTPTEVVSRAWRRDRLDVPIAPGLGLVLEEPHYDKYNKRFGSDGVHEPLVWEEVRERIQEFREIHVDSSIIQTEISEQPMLKWLATLPLHNFSGSEVVVVPEPPLGTKDAKNSLQATAIKTDKWSSKRNDKGSDNEAEDEDEGDLDQYRVVPIQKADQDGSTVPNGHPIVSLQEDDNNIGEVAMNDGDGHTSETKDEGDLSSGVTNDDMDENGKALGTGGE